MGTWKRIEDIYLEAAELPAEHREDFLDKACVGDDQLRREVESLLRYEEKSGDFMEKTALEVEAKKLSVLQTESMVGAELGSHRILSFVGSGGMATVYRAQNTQTGRIDAIKVLPPEFAKDKNRLQRFVREARAASALNHPNVAAVYETGDLDGLHYIVMEYIEGETLADFNTVKLEPAEIRDLGSKIADGLSAAHKKGIIHRDVKPSNIMITPTNQVKILDFGLAKVKRVEGQESLSGLSTRTLTATGTIVGTVAYMSPEQLLEEETDPRTDIFSLGVVCYELLTEHLPFFGESVVEQMDRILRSEPEAISRFNPDVPTDLIQIVNKCLQKDKEKRYSTAKELAVDLAEFREEEKGEKYGFWNRFRRSPRS
jgi:non-specific serine/threonine protein kinase